MAPRKVIIIGSGVAGMASAIRLAVAGFEVEVFESNSFPGGKLTVIEKDGYRFDAGPSLFTQPQQIEELFILAGEPIREYFQYTQADTVCHYFFENGKRLLTYADRQRLDEEFVTKLGEKKGAVLRYLDDAEKLYENIGTIFLNHSLHKSKTWLHKRVFNALKHVKSSYLFGTLHRHNQSKFKSPEAVQLFNRFATYNGSNPYHAPGMLSLIPHLEQNQGTFYPRGGMISITNALHRLAVKKGVKFHFGKKVSRILHENGIATGIVTDEHSHMADIVMSNGDVYYTYKNLVGDAGKTNKLSKLERSSSAMIFYWGINRQFPELGLHNIFFSDNYKKEFDGLFNSKTLFEDPTVYINITSKMESGHAPEGHENWFVMINTPANEGQEWHALIATSRTRIIEKLNRLLQTDLNKLFTSESVMDPVLIEQRTGTYKGSLYGSSSNKALSAFFRPANFTSTIKGLYFCGGTVHPGGGIPLCLRSAKIATDIIIASHAQHN